MSVSGMTFKSVLPHTAAALARGDQGDQSPGAS